jgi:hypothetical protein
VPAQHLVDGHAEQIGDVRADVADLEGGLSNHSQHPARLDAARDVDRFTCAVVQVDGCAGRQQIVDAAVDILTRNWFTPRLRY